MRRRPFQVKLKVIFDCVVAVEVYRLVGATFGGWCLGWLALEEVVGLRQSESRGAGIENLHIDRMGFVDCDETSKRPGRTAFLLWRMLMSVIETEKLCLESPSLKNSA